AHAYEREFGLSIPEWRVMAVLARYPDLSAVEVAERTAMDKVAVSRAVSSLLARKRLTRNHDDVDKRRSILRLSQAGQAVYKRVAPLALHYERQLLDALNPDERRTLDRLIARLTERARAIDHAESWFPATAVPIPASQRARKRTRKRPPVNSRGYNQ